MVTKAGQNIFFCSIGNFAVGSTESFKMLNDFAKQVQVQYNDLDRLKYSSDEPTFKDVIKLITDYLKDKYLDPLEEEKIYEKTNNNGQNAILYAGISAQGLPIVSQLFDINLLTNLNRDMTAENVELYSSDLSAKLATISMNTQIRAKTKIKEIHIEDIEENQLNNNKKIILFGDINGYSVDFIATGNFYKVKEIFKQLKSKLALDSAFNEEFRGDLRAFKHLRHYLDEVVKHFDHIN
jgi:hypothetical protein